MKRFASDCTLAKRVVCTPSTCHSSPGLTTDASAAKGRPGIVILSTAGSLEQASAAGTDAHSYAGRSTYTSGETILTKRLLLRRIFFPLSCYLGDSDALRRSSCLYYTSTLLQVTENY